MKNVVSLDQRRIVITGAARGLGRAYAEQAARAGARLMLADILDDAGRAAADDGEVVELALGLLADPDAGRHVAGLGGFQARAVLQDHERERSALGRRAGVLVAKAWCDLEVLVEPGDHDQLLELLRRLRQGIELARMVAARHQIIACPFRRRGSQNWGLYFQKTLFCHASADRRNDV